MSFIFKSLFKTLSLQWKCFKKCFKNKWHTISAFVGCVIIIIKPICLIFVFYVTYDLTTAIVVYNKFIVVFDDVLIHLIFIKHNRMSFVKIVLLPYSFFFPTFLWYFFTCTLSIASYVILFLHLPRLYVLCCYFLFIQQQSDWISAHIDSPNESPSHFSSIFPQLVKLAEIPNICGVSRFIPFNLSAKHSIGLQV